MRWRGALTAAILVAAALLSTSTLFFYRDNFSTHYPIKFLSAAAFRSGEIPYWNFADAGGQPLAGNPNTLTFYPDNVLYLVLPAPVAFNLHFWIHLIVAWWAMRALSRSNFAAWMYALSGVAISATAFYNLIVAVAFIPLALYAAEKRSTFLLGATMGMLALGGEPVTMIAAAIAVGIIAFRRMRIRDLAGAVAIAIVIALPQLIAWAEIAREVERSVPMSARTVLNASLHPIRIVEIFAGPIIGFLNDPGDQFRQRLFSTVFVGLIALPALLRRSRYTIMAAVMAFFALGRYNPIIEWMVENAAFLRVVRYPEKFVLPLVIALVVLAARFYDQTRFRKLWLAVTFLPLIWTAWRALPIDRLDPYRVTWKGVQRVHIAGDIKPGALPARAEYRRRAARLEPLFGAVAGLRYVINPSPDGMHALRSRLVLERFNAVPRPVKEKYLRAATGPDAQFVDHIVVARGLMAEAAAFENSALVVAPSAAITSPGRVTSFRERGQTIDIGVVVDGPALLLINQTYFRGWIARSGSEELTTMPLDVDRLGVAVPMGTTSVTLRFGRQRMAVAAALILSSALLLLAFGVEYLDRRPRQVERSGDENRLEG
jgi:hypothetical protein